MRPAVRGAVSPALYRPYYIFIKIFFHRDIKKLEAVQHRATRIIPVSKELPCEERLKNLNLPSIIKINKDRQLGYDDMSK